MCHGHGLGPKQGEKAIDAGFDGVPNRPRGLGKTVERQEVPLALSELKHHLGIEVAFLVC